MISVHSNCVILHIYVENRVQHYVMKFVSDLLQVGGFPRHSGFLNQ
jgi:hypothetical protein